MPKQVAKLLEVRSFPLALLALTAIALAACGGSDDDQEPTAAPPANDPAEASGANPADVEVIDAWAQALREGDVRAAAAYFAIPSVAQNGPTIRIGSRTDARLFNFSLPCGAVLVEAESRGRFTTATFRLTERPGAGTCGQGTGGEAQTAFVIEDGKITEWRRVAPDTRPAPGQAA